jgi:hypothetical protein
MGIIIPRPPMRKAERRRVQMHLARHSALMRAYEAQGMTREQASAAALRQMQEADAAAKDLDYAREALRFTEPSK